MSLVEIQTPPKQRKDKKTTNNYTLGINRQQLIDWVTLTRGDFMDKYGLRIWWNFPNKEVHKLPGSFLARVLPATDQTLYLQPSGQVATNANEQARKFQNFNPGTPLGGVANVTTRGVAAALGASRETTELYASAAQDFGNLVNSGLAAKGSATRGVGVSVADARAKQWGAPVDNTPQEVQPKAVAAPRSVGAAAANDPTVFSPPGELIDITRPDSEAMLMQAYWSNQPYQFKGGSIIVKEYRIDNVNFDRVSFDEFGYLKSLDEFKWDYSGSIASGNQGVSDGLVKQAEAQLKVADRLGVPLEWHVQRSQVGAFRNALGNLANKINFVPDDPPRKP